MIPLLPPEDPKPGAPSWVVTFSDMMALLLSFFVLLVSFSNMELEKFDQLAGSLRQAFSLGSRAVGPPGPAAAPFGAPGEEYHPSVSLAEEMELMIGLRQALEASGLGAGGSVRLTDRGVTLRIAGDLAFDRGSAEISGETLPLIEAVARVARTRPGPLEVQGHTDDRALPASSPYASNWELSAARAGCAARQLVHEGLPAARLRAVGLADSRPLAGNDDEAGRSLNRRLEFIFVSTREGRTPEPPAPDPPNEPSPSKGDTPGR